MNIDLRSLKTICTIYEIFFIHEALGRLFKIKMYEICIPVIIDLFWWENITSIFLYDSNYILTFKLSLLLLNNEKRKIFKTHKEV